VSTCHFRAVPVQARPKMRAGPCSPPCQDSEHGTALVFVSCRHGPKYFVPCRASDRAKRPCHDPPSNGTVQVPALASSIVVPSKWWAVTDPSKGRLAPLSHVSCGSCYRKHPAICIVIKTEPDIEPARPSIHWFVGQPFRTGWIAGSIVLDRMNWTAHEDFEPVQYNNMQ
jgi:hypothetical protein